jgi:DNA-binding response OmpR family regulator
MSRELGPLLLVEDDLAVARAVARVLRSAGYSVDVAGSCVQARGRAEERRYAVAIVDIELPDGLGTDLANELFDQRRVERVVFFTSEALQGLLKRAAELGPVVAKRDGPEALLTAVGEQLPALRARS